MRIGFHIPFSGSLDRLRQKVHISRGNSFQIYARSLKGVDKEGNPHSLHKLNEKKVSEFHEFLKNKKIHPIFVHAPYSYNLSQETNTNKSGEIINHEDLIVEDLEWAQQLGASYYVLQPGYYKKNNPLISIENIKNSLINIMEKSSWEGEILIKNTAGAGTEIASSFEIWNELISFDDRINGILDFARAYGSGYDFTTEKHAIKFVNLVEESVGWGKIKAIYVNDTDRGCGSNKQPSSPPPLGEGVIGFYGYEYILKQEELKDKIWLVENQPKPSYYDETIEYLLKYQ
jgi:deoxyribonuclease IV